MATPPPPPTLELGSGVTKRVLQAGGNGDDTSPLVPRSGDRVTLTFIARLCAAPDGTPGAVFDRSSDRAPLDCVVGSTAVIEGLSISLCSMAVGEKAVFHIPSALAFGSAGFNLPASGQAGGIAVPPHTDVEFEVSLLAVSPSKPAATSAASPAEDASIAAAVAKFDPYPDALRLKEMGNKRLAAGDFNGARYKYKQAQQFLALPQPVTGEDAVAARSALELTLHSNLAQACLQLELYEEAVEEASSVLRSDAMHEKCLFRRATAYKALGRADAATGDLTTLLAHHPSNALAQRLLAELQRRQAGEARRTAAAASDGAVGAELVETAASTPVHPSSEAASAVAAVTSRRKGAAASGRLAPSVSAALLAAAAKKAFSTGLYSDKPDVEEEEDEGEHGEVAAGRNGGGGGWWGVFWSCGWCGCGRKKARALKL